jgi:hypothetical protein
MAFHSKDGSIARSSRTHRRDKESILGLSGWLFADLLLAIAVIFLVVETKATADEGSKPITTTTTTTTTVSTSTTVASVKTGLISDPNLQLKIVIPGGAGSKGTADFRDKLKKATLYFDDREKKRTSVAELTQSNYKFGFIIWFAQVQSTSNKTHARYYSDLVTWLLEKKLITETQVDLKKNQLIPSLQYNDGDAGRDIILRVFLFK